MRSLVGVLVILTLILSGCQGAVNPKPVLAITLDEPSGIAYVTANESGIVNFTGHCSIEKHPVQKVTVKLTTSVNNGWTAQISPSSMVFTSTSPQTFICNVTVPAGTSDAVYGQLNITGVANTLVFQSTAHTSAIISVSAPISNQTSKSGHSNSTNNSTNLPNSKTINVSTGLLGLNGNQMILLGVVVAVILVSAAGVYLKMRRKDHRFSV